MRKVFSYLLISLDMDDYDIHKPMTPVTFFDPYSPEVLLIANLYSMEPPFYADVNNASRTMDITKLKTLGPFARAIYLMLMFGDRSDKKREDVLEIGMNFKNTDPLGRMCRSFLLFRGALMQKEWINPWRKVVGEDAISLPGGSTSTSQNLDVALGFSKCHTKYTKKQQPVLFIYSIHNCGGFMGFRMTDKRYSMYPSEQEVLLMEGFGVYVLDV